ncbi:MAG: hypothetical protein M3N54_01590 [Acidobacteriota bacterium]|nr:hypothetical protein [Acidobacteriota bacterium]
MVQRALVALFEHRRDEALVGPSHAELLMYVAHTGFQVQTLIGPFNNAPAGATSISLLQAQIL